MRLLALIGFIFLLSSCAKTDSSCSNEQSKNSVISLVREQIARSLRDQFASKDPNDNAEVSVSSIKDATDSLLLSIDNIRTASIDPNSTKSHCEADLTIKLSVDTFNKANQARQANGQNNISDLADNTNLKSDADKFSGGITYTIQPTDDHNSLFTEIQSGVGVTKFAIDVLSSSLTADSVVNAQRQQKALADQQTAQQTADLAAQKSANLNLAKTDNQLAIQTIGAVWQAIPQDQRIQMLPLQRAWLAKVRADCRVESASTSIDPLELQTADLTCESKANRDRADELKKYIDTGSQQGLGPNGPMVSGN